MRIERGLTSLREQCGPGTVGHFSTSYNDSLFLEKVAFKLQCGLPHCKLDFWLVSSRLGLLKAQILTLEVQVLLLILNISTYSF